MLIVLKTLFVFILVNQYLHKKILAPRTSLPSLNCQFQTRFPALGANCVVFHGVHNGENGLKHGTTPHLGT